MKKSQKRNINYTSISKNESRLLSDIKNADLTVFGVEEARTLTEWKDSKIHNTLRSLQKKGLILRVKRNCYTPESIVSERLFEIATETVKPSYIGFWTALSYYGFTEQQVPLVQLISTKQVDDLNIGQHRVQVTTFKPEIFYGYKRMEGFVTAEKEKALVDSIYLPTKCGGLDELAKCLSNSWEQIDHKKLAEYTIHFGNNSLVSRMGYLVDTLKLDNEGFIEWLIPHRSKGYVMLSPGNHRISGHNSRWKIIINHVIRMEEII